MVRSCVQGKRGALDLQLAKMLASIQRGSLRAIMQESVQMASRSFVYRVVILAILTLLSAGFFLLLADEEKLRVPGEQSVNKVYTIEIDPLRGPRVYSVFEIEPRYSGDRFGHDDPPLQTDPSPLAEPTLSSKIDPRLLRLVETSSPDLRVEVHISFPDTETLPRLPSRLPSLDPRESATSSRNQAILRERKIIIEQIRALRQAHQAPIIDRLTKYGLIVKNQHVLVNVLFGELPLSGVLQVAADPDVRFIGLNIGEELPFNNSNPENDVSVARSQIRSDGYSVKAPPVSRVAVIDSGVRDSHILLSNPSHLDEPRDCVNGGPTCEFVAGADYDPSDCLSGHGTSTVAIITGNNNLGDNFRGVGANLVQSLKMAIPGPKRLFLFPPTRCVSDPESVLKAFHAACELGSDIIVAELQEKDLDGMIEEAADKAYDAPCGAVVIAAAGNFPGTETVKSPGRAHKVLAVGAYDVQTFALEPNSSRGPTTDGRVKPDLLAPTNTETARNMSDTALGVFTGTSGATPYVGAAAALVRDWLVMASSGFTDSFVKGHVYAWLIASGNQFFFNNDRGVGPLKLLSDGFVTLSELSVGNKQTLAVPFRTFPGDRRIDAAIWWPEDAGHHNRVSIRLKDPFGKQRVASSHPTGVFQRVRLNTLLLGSPLPSGLWTLEVSGDNVTTDSQFVYTVIHVAPSSLYVHDALGNLGTVHPPTGHVETIGPMGVVMTDIAFDGSGRLYGVSLLGFFSIDPLTATRTLIGLHGIPSPNALVVASDGTLYAAGETSGFLFTIDPATGAGTVVGNTGFLSAGDLGFNGGQLFMSSTTDQLIEIDLSDSAKGTAVGPFGFTDVFGLATAADGQLYGLTGTSVIAIDTRTGRGSLVSDYTGQGLGKAYGATFFGRSQGTPSHEQRQRDRTIESVTLPQVREAREKQRPRG